MALFAPQFGRNKVDRTLSPSSFLDQEQPIFVSNKFVDSDPLALAEDGIETDASF
jgi:hypothetical protein